MGSRSFIVEDGCAEDDLPDIIQTYEEEYQLRAELAGESPHHTDLTGRPEASSRNSPRTTAAVQENSGFMCSAKQLCASVVKACDAHVLAWKAS